MTRSEYYTTALKNLGLISFVHFEIVKRLPHSSAYALNSKSLDYPVLVRPNTSDLAVFYEVLVTDEYRCVAALNSPELVLDLGANVGFSTAYFLSRWRDASVIAVEPHPENYAQLCKNVVGYGDRIITIQAAVWPRSELLSLDDPGKGEEWGVRVAPSSNGTIKTVTIPELLDISGHKRISLLKIDIEGAEVHLFKGGAADKWLNRVDNIVIELHGDEARNTFHDAIADLPLSISQCENLTVCLR